MTDIEQAWEDASSDPDPEKDLDYRCMSIEVVAAEQYGQYLLLPSDEEQLREDAFIVADTEDLVDLKDMA